MPPSLVVRRPYRAAWRERDGRVIVRHYVDKDRRDYVVCMAIASGLEVLKAPRRKAA
jgi:hypothetical protein